MKHNNNDIVKQYRFREFVDYVEKNTDDTYYSNNSNNISFCCSWKETLKLARNGIKNQGNIEKIVKNMSLLEHVKTKTFGMSETGLCVDIGAYLTGEPECFISEEFDYRPKKVVKVMVNTVMSYMVDKEAYQNRGAGIISLIQMLKKQGYIVRILIYDCFNYNGKKHTLFLNIPSNPLDIQSLSYCLCSESLTRKLAFAWLELESNSKNCDGYGSVSKVDEVSISKDIIHFEGINNESCKYKHENDTKDYIVKTFDKFLELNREKSQILEGV